jgi:hypothetical protein
MFLVGERLVQHNNQPAFFCRRIGVQEVIVNQRVDSILSLKVIHTFILLLSIFSLLSFIVQPTAAETKKVCGSQQCIMMYICTVSGLEMWASGVDFITHFSYGDSLTYEHPHL